jgi:capsular exopolysaccharide synthesis family protein
MFSGPRGERLTSQDLSPLRTIIDHPLSRYAEAIRTIKLAADLNGVASVNRVIGVTSTIPGEGKTTISSALAQSIAQAGSRVILVDGDLRNPSLTRIIAPDATTGVLEVLSGTAALDRVAWKDPLTGMTVLPAIVTAREASSEMLGSLGMKKLFEVLRSSYDYVVVDLPPLAPIIDVQATTHLIDCYVLVIEWAKTSPAVARYALSRAPRVHSKLLGAVLNKVDIKRLASYDGRHANYYSNKAYGRYGYAD